MWGELWVHPFLTPVWGTVSSWAGALSFFAGAFYFISGRRQDNRAQASLISITRKGMLVTVRNQSDQSIANVGAYAEALSLFKTVSRNDFQELVILASEPIGQFPSHQFYLNAQGIIKRMKEQIGSLVVKPDEAELPPGKHVELSVPGLATGGIVNYVTFRDARGVDWTIDILSSTLSKVKKRRHLFRRLASVIRTSWWIGNNKVVSGWQKVTCREPKSDHE